MPARTKTLAAAVAITAIAVVGMDAATYAGTGDSLILGKLNRSHQTTHVTNTGKGPALSLHAKGNRPALAVDSKAKVTRLNADRVDGKNAGSLQNNVRVYTSPRTPSALSHVFQLPDFPNGRYQATYEIYMSGDAADGRCFFESPESGQVAGYTAASTSYVLGLSASAVINKRSTDWVLDCSARGEWNVFYPVRVTLTRIDRTIGGRLGVVATTASNEGEQP